MYISRRGIDVSLPSMKLLVALWYLLCLVTCDVQFNTTRTSSPRDALSLIEARSNLYFVGGFEFHDNVATNKIEVFDLINRTWSTPLHLPSRRAYVTPVVQEPYLYFVGGYEYSNPPHVYDQNVQAFVRDAGQGPSVLIPIDLSLHQSILTVVGIYSVDFLDLTTNQWNSSTPLSNVKSTILGGIIFASEDIVVRIGGTNVTSGEKILSAWIYNRTNDHLAFFQQALGIALPSVGLASLKYEDFNFTLMNRVISIWTPRFIILHRLDTPDWYQIGQDTSSIITIVSSKAATFIFVPGGYYQFDWTSGTLSELNTPNGLIYLFAVDGFVGYVRTFRGISNIFIYEDESDAWISSIDLPSDPSTTFFLSVNSGPWACLASDSQIITINVRENVAFLFESTTSITSMIAGSNSCQYFDEGAITPRRRHIQFQGASATNVDDEYMDIAPDQYPVALVGNTFFTSNGGVFDSTVTSQSYNYSGMLRYEPLWVANDIHFVMMENIFVNTNNLRKYYSHVDIYDLDAQVWLNSTVLPFDDMAYDQYLPATALGNKLLVWNELALAVYDPQSGQWTTTENGTLGLLDDSLHAHIPVLTINNTAFVRTSQGRFTKYHADAPFEWTVTPTLPDLPENTTFYQYFDSENGEIFVTARSPSYFSTLYTYNTQKDSIEISLLPNSEIIYLTVVPVGDFLVGFSPLNKKIYYFEISTASWYTQNYDSNVRPSAVYRTSNKLSVVAGGIDKALDGMYSDIILIFEEGSITAPPVSPASPNGTNEVVPPVGLSEGELIAAIVVPIGAALIAGALLMILLLRKRRQRRRRGDVSMTGLASRYGQWFIPFDQIKFGDQLGRGASGQVFKGSWKGSPVALKVSMTQANKTVISELELMIQMRPHPNVVQLFGFSVHPETDSIILVIEFCDGGSLDDVLFETNQQIPMEQKIAFVSGIAKGLSHLHSNNIVHRDVAARNVLLHKNEPKLTDFGMSRLIEDDTQRGTTKSELGPIRWMSPESLKNKEYSAKSDVWSFGIVMYEVIAQQEPHLSADPIEIGRLIRDNGVTPDIPEHCLNKLASIMRSCWEMNPNKRPSIEQIMDQLEGTDL